MPLLLSRQENRMTKIELFNTAYKLAWDQLQSDPELLAKPSGHAKRLNDQVQKLLKDSSSPPVHRDRSCCSSKILR
jgi:hypothetical protein